MTEDEEQYLTLLEEGDGRVDLQDNGYKKYPRVFFFEKQKLIREWAKAHPELTKDGN